MIHKILTPKECLIFPHDTTVPDECGGSHLQSYHIGSSGKTVAMNFLPSWDTNWDAIK